MASDPCDNDTFGNFIVKISEQKATVTFYQELACDLVVDELTVNCGECDTTYNFFVDCNSSSFGHGTTLILLLIAWTLQH